MAIVRHNDTAAISNAVRKRVCMNGLLPQPDIGLLSGNIMDLLLDAVCVVDVQGRFVCVSAAFERIFGYTPTEVVGRSMLELVYPDDRENTLKAAQEIMAGQPNPHFQNRYVRKDAGIIDIMWSARWSATDQVRIAVARDITELKRAESMQSALHAISEAAHASEDLLDLFGQIHRIIDTLLPARNFFVALYNGERDELSFPYFVDEREKRPETQPLDCGLLSAEVIRSGKAMLLTPDTRHDLPARVHPIIGPTWLDWLGVPLNSQNGVIGALVVQSYSGAVRYSPQDKALLQFVSTQVAAAIERKQTHTRLQYLARHDQLTGLPNRELFHDRLRIALATAKAGRRQMAVFYLDLDQFKPVNDNHGHELGDMLLRETAARISDCLRVCDTVARVGGDEFVALLDGIDLPEHASLVAAQVRAAIERPFDIDGQSVRISVSIGIATYPRHGEDSKQLLRHADDAMYCAKRHGGNRVWLHDAGPSRNQIATEPIAPEHAIDQLWRCPS